MRMRIYRVGNSSDEFGFTLLEIVVVMLILIVTLGLVLPQTSSLFIRSDLKSSSRRLAGAVSYARSQAMLEGRFWELTMDLDTGDFWASPAGETEDKDQEPDSKRSLDGEVRFLDVHKMQEEQTSEGRVVLRFQPKGMVEPAVIHLSGSGNEAKTLLVKTFSGRVVIHDGYLEGVGDTN